MSQELMQECIESKDIRKYIHHFGVKIHRVYPRLLDVEDSKNELWVAVFRAIRERYNSKIPLILFAKHAIFSQYGSMVKIRGNANRRRGERTTPEIEKIGYDDPCYNAVEVGFTLDQIEKDLEERASASRQYRYAVQVFGLLRNGVAFKDCCQRLRISKTYIYTIFHEIIRECSGKYREEAISKG